MKKDSSNFVKQLGYFFLPFLLIISREMKSHCSNFNPATFLTFCFLLHYNRLRCLVESQIQQGLKLIDQQNASFFSTACTTPLYHALRFMLVQRNPLSSSLLFLGGKQSTIKAIMAHVPGFVSGFCGNKRTYYIYHPVDELSINCHWPTLQQSWYSFYTRSK